MAKREYSWLQSTMQKMGSTRLGAWFFSHTQSHLDKMILKLTNNRTTITNILAGFPIIVLTSKGAQSGLLRTVPLVGVPDESGSDRIALIASNYGKKRYPAWYHNLKANPQAMGSIRGQTTDYFAREAEGEEYDRFWVAAKDIYKGFSNYQERVGDRHIPIMVLTPIERCTQRRSAIHETRSI
jgi:deazaflavin-dependent oxidoreductase (nitroreductase family)